jgi:hypothetical protein
MSAKSKKLWAEVKSQIEAGNFPKVFVTKAGKLALDGSAAEIPADIAAMFPADIRAAAEAKLVERIEAEKIEDEKARAKRAECDAKRQAVIDQFGERRVWRLSGFHVEDLSMDRYTFGEIKDWLAWDAYNLRHNHASVSVICERGEEAGGDWHLDVSEHFSNPCNDRVRTPSFETLATRLRDYVQMRRKNASQHN